MTGGSVRRDRLSAVPLAVAIFLGALDQTVVATALPTLAREFSSLHVIPWAVSAYLLTAAVATPVTGRLVDRYGARVVFTFAMVLFVLGSAGCGFAQSMWMLVVARAVQGAGGGALGTAGLTLVSQLAGPDRLGRFQSYFGLLFGVASIAGPPLGGVLTSTVGWRWIFHSNVLIGVVIMALVWRRGSAPDTPGPGVNLASAALLAGALGSLVGLSIWGSTAGTTMFLALLVGCAITIGAFFWAERRTSTPLLPLGVLRSSGVGAAAAVGCLSAMGLFILITFLPAMLQMASARSPAAAGALMIPFMAAVMASSLWAGRQVDRKGHHWTFIATGTAIAGGSLLVISLLGSGATVASIIACGVAFGFGIGMVMQMVIVTAQRSAPPDMVGAATGTVLLLRMVGSLLGVAATGGLLTILITRGLSPMDSPLSATDIVHGAEPTTDLGEDVLHVIGTAYQTIFAIGSGLLLAASALAWKQVRKATHPTPTEAT